jgi:hypothetical protein
LNYFDSIGLECPPYTNPAEFILDLSSVDNRTPEAEIESSERVQKLVTEWEKRSLEMEQPVEEDKAILSQLPKKKTVNWFVQTAALTSRSFKNLIRDR